MDKSMIVQVSAIILGFMIAFFNKWLFIKPNQKVELESKDPDKKGNNKKNIQKKDASLDYENECLEYLIIVFGLLSEILLALTVILGLSSSLINENHIWLLMTLGIGFLSISIILATIYEIIATKEHYNQKRNS